MTDAWVTMASYCPPAGPKPDFEAIVADEVARFAAAAREAGLDPEAHVRVTRRADEVTVDVSAALNAVFTPPPTEWWAK